MKLICIWMLSVVVLIVTGSHAARAHSQRNSSRSALALVTENARELVRLRQASPDHAFNQRPSSGVAARVSQVLSTSGLAPTALQSVSPEAESSEHGVLRQRATLTLVNLTLPQLGKFLVLWRTDEPGWIVSGLDVSPSGSGTPGADLPLRAVITIEATFRAHPTVPNHVSGVSR